MVKMRWDNVEEVGDTSNFVSTIGKHIKQTAPLIRTQLGANRKYFTNFCLKFVTSFMPKVIAALQKCKHVSTIGAEQLLLDMQSMRVALLGLPSAGAAVARKAPGSYTKRVTQGIGKAEMILKVGLWSSFSLPVVEPGLTSGAAFWVLDAYGAARHPGALCARLHQACWHGRWDLWLSEGAGHERCVLW